MSSLTEEDVRVYPYVITDTGVREVADTEQLALDAFVTAFVAKKSVPPAGHWRVPGVGYCLFSKTPLDLS